MLPRRLNDRMNARAMRSIIMLTDLSLASVVFNSEFVYVQYATRKDNGRSGCHNNKMQTVPGKCVTDY